MEPGAGAQARDRTLDVLRAVATVRVVTYHATGAAVWSWFAAMPAMFFVGGALFAGSLERRPAQTVLRERFRRILIPMWAFSATVAVVITVAGAWDEVPLWGPIGFIIPISPAMGPRGVDNPLYWTWMGLWYINAYALFMIVGIPLRRLHRRWPVQTIAVLATPVVLSGLLRSPGVGALTANLVFWVLGYSYHDRRNRLPSSRVLWVTAGVSMTLAIVYAAGASGFHVVTTAIPTLNNLVGLAWVAAAIAARRPIAELVSHRWADVTVTFIQARALTIYLWHAAAIGIVGALAHRVEFLNDHVWARVAVVFPLTLLLVLALGWIEDLAARRPPKLVPDVRRTIDLRASTPPISAGPLVTRTTE